MKSIGIFAVLQLANIRCTSKPPVWLDVRWRSRGWRLSMAAAKLV